MLGVVRSGKGRRFGALALGWAVVLVLVASPAGATPTLQRAAPFHLEEATIERLTRE